MKRQITTLIFLLTLIAPSAWAINGTQLTGFTAINEALGGSGAAYPQDISTILINPAGLSELDRQASFNLFLAFPSNQMDTSASVLGNPGGTATTPGTTAGSADDTVLLPGGGLVFPTPLLDNRLTFGMGVLATSGFSADYRLSRLGAAANTYDNHTFYGLWKIAPAASFQLNDQLSFGLALHLNRAQLETNSALFSGAQTAGADRSDGTFGFGMGFGVLYKPLDFLQAGLSYTTEQWMKDFERYEDLLPGGLNFPRQLQLGITTLPPWIPGLVINTDFRWINWSGASGGFGSPVEGGAGLGWQDQYIFMFGAQYQLFDPLVVRLGYNYGRSVVPARSVFGALLGGPVHEHHISTGFGWNIWNQLSLDMSYVATLSNTVTDNGTRTDAFAGLTTGAFTKQSVHQMSTQLTLGF